MGGERDIVGYSRKIINRYGKNCEKQRGGFRTYSLCALKHLVFFFYTRCAIRREKKFIDTRRNIFPMSRYFLSKKSTFILGRRNNDTVTDRAIYRLADTSSDFYGARDLISRDTRNVLPKRTSL